MMENIEKYVNQDRNHPKYLFHGSPILTDKIVPNLSHDDGVNKSNEELALFLFPVFKKTVPYALKKAFCKPIEGVEQEESYFETSLRGISYPFATIKNRVIDEEEKGYVYVFLKDETMVKDKDNYQYRCYHELIPIDIIEVKFKDFASDFAIIYSEEKSKTL